MAFGTYPLVSLADARSRRDEAYTVLCEGHDPSIAKKLKIEANLEAGRQTFERIAREWYENATPQWANRALVVRDAGNLTPDERNIKSPGSYDQASSAPPGCEARARPRRPRHRRIWKVSQTA